MLRRLRPQTRPPPPAQCPLYLRFAVSPPFPPPLRHGALRPKKMGPRACGSARAAPCRTRTPPDAAQPARWLRSAWVPFVSACAPASVPGFVGSRCRLPSQVRRSAIQHNAGNYAQRKKPRCPLRRIICIMCKLPPPVFDPPPAVPSAPEGLPGSFVQALWLIGMISAPAFSLSR